MTWLTNTHSIGRYLFAHPTDARFFESEEVDWTINLSVDAPSTTRPRSVGGGTVVQFLGQHDSGGGEAVGAAEAAGHHVPGEDIDLPF